MPDDQFQNKPELILPRQPFSTLYSAYAAGALDPAFALMVETQAALRSDVAAGVMDSEIIAGALLELDTPAELSVSALDDVFARIDGQSRADARAQRAAHAAFNELEEVLALPQPLREYTLDAIGVSGWDGLTIGVRRVNLDIGSEIEVELYRIAPGSGVPRHSHGGQEYTLVVTGGFTDETASYGPGDLCVKGPEDTHKPVGDPGEPCYALAVRDAGLKFTGVLGLVQRTLGR